MKRMSELKAEMKSQLPKTLDRGYAESTMSAATLSDDSEWEDVDTDNEDDGGDDRRDRTSRGETEAVKHENRRHMKIKLASAIKGDADNCERKESVRLPKIIPKRKVEVIVKTDHGGEDDSEDDHGDDETVGDSRQSGILVNSSQSSRIQGPSKPIHNFTHRSKEFLDMKVAGKQTYSDDDVIACVRDVNKLTSARVNDLDKATNEVVLPTVSSKMTTKGLTMTAVKAVPVKFKVLRRKYRMDSPGRRARRVVKRHKAPKPLPQIKSETNQSANHLDSLAQIKRTHHVPKYVPQRVNFLPDIYDKYARKSVSTASTKVSTKPPTSRKSRKR